MAVPVSSTGPQPASDPTSDPFVASVVTPEAVLLQFRPAGLASRVLALALDAVLQLVLLWLVFVALAVMGETTETTAVIVFTVAAFLLLFGYPVVQETWWGGATMGKRALGLRVITTEGGPVRFHHAAIRALLLVVELSVPPGGLTALVAALLTRRGQRLGDLVAGTIVIRVRGADERNVPVSFSPPPGHEAYTSSLDVSALRPRQYQVVRRFLLRAAELAPGARWRLSLRLASAVAAAVGGAIPPGLHPETYLLCVAAASQQRSRWSGFDPSPPPPTGAPVPGPPVGPPAPPGVVAAGPGPVPAHR